MIIVWIVNWAANAFIERSVSQPSPADGGAWTSTSFPSSRSRSLLIVMPGPDTAVVTKNALLGGRRSGIYAAFGVAIGLTVWTVAAALGIAALLQASAVAFLVLKIAGAIYLVWIGIQMLRARDLAAAATAAGHGVAPRAARGKALRQGLLSDLSNPKIAVFFTSFLPQFVARRRPGVRGAADARARRSP